MTGLAGRIADFIGQTEFDGLPELARERATRAVTDTVGVISAGAASPTLAIMRDYAAGVASAGEVPVLGCNLRTDADHAALLNGMSGAALDFDDGYPFYPVHASTVVASALVSAIGTSGADPVPGPKILEAYIAGIEVVTALGRGLGIGHYMNRGFHATSTLGAFAGIAALAKLNRLDARRIRQALGIAASMAGGIQGNFGSMMKSFHSGWAARNALIAIRLAERGLTAGAAALDGPNGFFRAFGDETADPERAADLLGTPLALIEHGIGMKRFPCVNAAARPLAGLLELKATCLLKPDDVAQIVVVLPPGSTKPMPFHRPETGHEGQFSLEYVLAAGLIDDRVGIATFSDEMVRRDIVRPMLERVEAKEDPRCVAEDPLAETRGPGPRGFVEVHVAKKSGDIHQTRVDVAPGYPGNEMSAEEMWEKFENCAAFAGIAEEPARAAFDGLMDLTSAQDFMAVLAPLCTSDKALEKRNKGTDA